MKHADIKEQFREFIREKGLKNTVQREAILNEVLQTGGHFEIEDIVYQMRKKNIPVSRATIYRTLNLLKDMGLINEVIKIDNKTIYELALKHHHDHLICKSCKKIIEFTDEEIEKLQDKICKAHNFFPETHRLEIYGYCQECFQKRKKT